MLGDPFLASLRRHRLLTGLVVLQAALTAVVLTLALSKLGQWQARIWRPSGLDEARLARLLVRGPQDATAQRRELAALAQIPGIAGVSPINQLPFGSEYWSSDFGRKPRNTGGVVRAAVYFGDPGLRERLGLALREGRDFLPGDFGDLRGNGGPPRVLLDATLAKQMFPGEDAVGRMIYQGQQPIQVIGVYAPLQAPTPDGAASLIAAKRIPPAASTSYVLQLRDARLPSAAAVAAALHQASPARWILDYRSVAQLRDGYFRPQRWLCTGLLLGLALWLAGTGVGLANLADLMLQSRLRAVGLCRALGARSGQIRWQLRRENAVLAAGGALIGLALLQLLLHVWPGLAQQLGMIPPTMQVLSLALVVVTGQCALWPIVHAVDGASPAALLRHA